MNKKDLSTKLTKIEKAIESKPPVFEEVGEELCKYCPLPEPHSYQTPNGLVMCEGVKCEEAYCNMLDAWSIEQMEEEMRAYAALERSWNESA